MDDIRPRVLDFILNPAAWIHDSWKQALSASRTEPAPELAGLVDRAWRRPVFSRFLFRRFGLKRGAPRPGDFTTPSARLALLDADTVERGALRVGACFHGAALAREIDGGRLRRVRAALGADAFDFARNASGDGAVAEALARAGKDGMGFVSRLETLRLGWRVLAQEAGGGDQMRRRLRLKLPPGMPDGADGDAGRMTRELAGPGLALEVFRNMTPTCPLLAE